MVPNQTADGQTPFEDRSVERSLKALETEPGGIFSSATFELPEAVGQASATEPGAGSARTRAGLLVPRWALYAVIVLLLTTATVSFVAGVWWAGRDRWQTQP